MANIYVDEVLFRARLHPQTAAKALGPRARTSLYRAVRQVLQRAIEGHAEREALPRTWLIHRRTGGSTCPRCGGRIERINVGGRSTYVCPSCQRRRAQ